MASASGGKLFMDITQDRLYDGQAAAQPRGLTLRLELAAYMALLLLALVLRVAELDTVPLSGSEARQALAAWRVAWPNAAGGDIVPDSPLLFALHVFSFSTLGGNEFTARIFTALAGVALMLSPALFRDLLGRHRALLLSTLLFFSPALLISSRADSPVVWTLLVAVSGLWALWRWRDTRQAGYSALAVVCLLAVLLLTDPTGPVLALVLLGAAVVTLWDKRAEGEAPDAALRELLSGGAWLRGLLVGGLVVVLVSTLFLTYPEGLSAVSGLVGAGARGLTAPPSGAPVVFPLLAVLFYEPVLVLFGVVGALWLARSGRLAGVERFLLGWLIFGAVVSVLYAGLGADHALWVVLPLAGLTSRVVVELLRDSDRLIWYTPGWAKWALALAMLALLLVLSVHTQALGRALLKSPEGTVQISQIDARSAVWVLVALLFMITGYFMAGSVWGGGTALRGWALGLLAFGLVTSLGAGWNTAVFDADSPVEFWHIQPTSRNTRLLRQTLTELSARESRGFPMLEVAALAPEDGVVAWLLHDYPNTRFVQHISEARTLPVVLLPELAEPPDLGGSYVGQPFTITGGWSSQSVRLADFPAWWLQREVRTPAQAANRMILWLRQDIYSGVPFNDLGR